MHFIDGSSFCTCTTSGKSGCPIHDPMGVWRWWNPPPSPTRTFVAYEPKVKITFTIPQPVEAQRPEEV